MTRYILNLNDLGVAWMKSEEKPLLKPASKPFYISTFCSSKTYLLRQQL